jgi:hypothetical protein
MGDDAIATSDHETRLQQHDRSCTPNQSVEANHVGHVVRVFPRQLRFLPVPLRVFPREFGLLNLPVRRFALDRQTLRTPTKRR